ncbi:hypothetical protein [Curtobacterium aurantiacum]|uniref:hypothetical protein n=1 Tax=Curtobacterium aurantiacum TaxID=3236919 RepID=UPI001BDE646F|nr:hypothetical protein [Curtobacterium flaccumfaciens]MBT1679785.1 hypothetical protein [Curtobacterium flaccumfaciens pv. flaccumfaciens]
MTYGSGVAPHISVRVPEDWSLDGRVPGTFVATAPEIEGALFRPTVVMTSAPTSGPVHVVSAEAIASILASGLRAQLLSVTTERLHGLPDRTIEYGYDGDETWVCVRHWLAVVEDVQVHVTGSCGVEEFSVFGPVFRSVLATFRAERTS